MASAHQCSLDVNKARRDALPERNGQFPTMEFLVEDVRDITS